MLVGVLCSGILQSASAQTVPPLCSEPNPETKASPLPLTPNPNAANQPSAHVPPVAQPEPQTVPPLPPAPPQPTETAVAPRPQTQHKPSTIRPLPIKLAGRIFVRNTLTQVDVQDAPWANKFQIASARLGADYRKKQLRAQIVVDFAGNDVAIKNAYLRVRLAPNLFLQAGRFKRPISAIALTSTWDLPSIDRGLLSAAIKTTRYTTELPTGGRSEGLLLQYSYPQAIGATVSLGVFNAELLKARGDIEQPFEDSENQFADGYARIQLRPIPHIQLGATAAVVRLVGTPNLSVDYGFLASIDATWMSEWLRIWTEAFVGSSSYIDDTKLTAEGIFWATRTLVAPRIRRPFFGLRSIDPFISLSAMQLTNKVEDTRSLEFAGGIAITPKKRWRFQLEFKHRTEDRRLAGSNTLLVQLGARF